MEADLRIGTAEVGTSCPRGGLAGEFPTRHARPLTVAALECRYQPAFTRTGQQCGASHNWAEQEGVQMNDFGSLYAPAWRAAGSVSMLPW